VVKLPESLDGRHGHPLPGAADGVIQNASRHLDSDLPGFVGSWGSMDVLSKLVKDMVASGGEMVTEGNTVAVKTLGDR
jgi:hypothetical protein